MRGVLWSRVRLTNPRRVRSVRCDIAGRSALSSTCGTQLEDNVRVNMMVLSEEESELVFCRTLYDRGIQLVWLDIENHDESGMRFLPLGLDPDYFFQ